MRILITGVLGFLGRNLVRYLEQFDDELVLTDLPPGLFADPLPWTNNWLIYHCDLSDNLEPLDKAMTDVDVVIHLANRARIEPSWNDYENYYSLNVTGSQKLFELAQKKAVKKFIYISSSSVYGNNGNQIQRESDPLCPTNPYAVSKVAAELALKAQSQKGHTDLVIVRPFTMYGDFMDYGPNSLVIAKFITALKKGQPLTIDGSGKQSRDFLHASDAVHGIKLIMENSKNGDIFNLGSGTAVVIQRLADAVSNRQVRVPDRLGPVSVTCADISKLSSLGFKPTVDVVEWLTSVVADLKLDKQ